MDRGAPYRYRGARAMVLLQEEELRCFVGAWRVARTSGIGLPETDDSDYASYAALLHHILRASRGYLTWMCEQLGLPDPGVNQVPDVERIESVFDEYLVHLLSRWQYPLREVPEERFHHPEFRSRWGVLYCIDAMLEHAVMHAIRHRFQLEELLGQKTSRE